MLRHSLFSKGPIFIIFVQVCGQFKIGCAHICLFFLPNNTFYPMKLHICTNKLRWVPLPGLNQSPNWCNSEKSLDSAYPSNFSHLFFYFYKVCSEPVFLARVIKCWILANATRSLWYFNVFVVSGDSQLSATNHSYQQLISCMRLFVCIVGRVLLFAPKT